MQQARRTLDFDLGEERFEILLHHAIQDCFQSFTIEPPVLDFSGLARLYDWRYLAASTQTQLHAALGKLGTAIQQNTLLELKLDAALKPVTASRHF